MNEDNLYPYNGKFVTAGEYTVGLINYLKEATTSKCDEIDRAHMFWTLMAIGASVGAFDFQNVVNAILPARTDTPPTLEMLQARMDEILAHLNQVSSRVVPEGEKALTH